MNDSIDAREPHTKHIPDGFVILPLDFACAEEPVLANLNAITCLCNGQHRETDLGKFLAIK